MGRKWYRIVGLTQELVEAWNSDLRDDILIWNEGEDIEARICLTWPEAVRMKFQMMRNNINKPYLLRLVKDC